MHEQKSSSVYCEAMKEFEEKWQAAYPLDGEIISKYSTKLNYAIERWEYDYDLSAAKIKPNFMQRKALKELNRYRAVGTNRALVVASAGARRIITTGRKALISRVSDLSFLLAVRRVRVNEAKFLITKVTISAKIKIFADMVLQSGLRRRYYINDHNGKKMKICR